MKFEETLIAAREKRGLSLREAAARIGISHTYLSALEKGFDPRSGKALIPSQRVLLQIANAYGLDQNRLLSSFSVTPGRDIYSDMGYRLKELRKENPEKFREILEIVYSD